MKGERSKEKNLEPAAPDLAPCPINSGSDFAVRAMTAADLAAVAAIESENSSPWTDEQLAGERDQAGGWQFVAAAAAAGRVCGFVCGRSCAGEAELLKIAVAGQCRRQGIGAQLVAQVLRYLAEQGVDRCFLELRGGNLPALALYERFGFRRVGLRKDYYTSPPEDAIIMEKTILPAR